MNEKLNTIKWVSNENGVYAITPQLQEEIDMEILRMIREEQANKRLFT